MKLKFLLIDIGYDCEELNEPLGIETLLSYLRVYSPSVKCDIYSANFDNTEYGKFLFDFCPDVIGFSTHINTWDRFDRFYNISNKYFKKSNKEPIYIVGGILGTYEFNTVLERYSNVICSIGEGEESISNLLNIVATNKNITIINLINNLLTNNCPNLALMVKDQVILTERRVLNNLEDLNICVDHRYLDSVISKNGIVRMEASRGCPWNKCSFCVLNWKYAGTQWRPFSINKIINEIIDLSSMGAKTIYFTDEEFIAGRKERLFTLISYIQQEKNKNAINPDVEFVASTSVQAISGKYEIDKESIKVLLKKMKKVGFRSFFLGIESGSNSQLKRFNKGTTVSEIESTLRLLRELNIEVDVGYILFDPFLTIDELKDSLSFLKRNGLEKHISRFAKRLRLVPFTPFCHYKNLKKGEYDSNLVEQKYLFKYDRVLGWFDVYLLIDLLSEISWFFYEDTLNYNLSFSEFSEANLLEFLFQIKSSPKWAVRFTNFEAEDIRFLKDFIVDRTLLIKGRGGFLKFIHKSFQEYLVSWYMFSLLIDKKADYEKIAECHEKIISPEVSEFIKGQIQRVQKSVFKNRLIFNNCKKVLELIEKKKEFEQYRARIGVEQLTYNLGMIKAPEVMNYLKDYLQREKDLWIIRGITIGLSFNGDDNELNEYVDRLYQERGKGGLCPENDVNIGFSLSFFGDQPFDDYHPDIDQNLPACKHTVERLVYQLSTIIDKPSWRPNLYTLLDLQNRDVSKDDYWSTMKQLKNEIHLIVDSLEKDTKASGWPETKKMRILINEL